LLNGDHILISSIEDMIIDRLCAYKFWDYKFDGEWAKIMLNSQSDEFSIDFSYLQKRAEQEDVTDVLNKILAEMEICLLITSDPKKAAEAVVKNQIDPHLNSLNRLGISEENAKTLHQKLHELVASPAAFDLDEKNLTAWGTKYDLARESMETSSSGIRTSIIYDNF